MLGYLFSISIIWEKPKLSPKITVTKNFIPITRLGEPWHQEKLMIGYILWSSDHTHHILIWRKEYMETISLEPKNLERTGIWSSCENNFGSQQVEFIVHHRFAIAAECEHFLPFTKTSLGWSEFFTLGDSDQLGRAGWWFLLGAPLALETPGWVLNIADQQICMKMKVKWSIWPPPN